jgi:hypothetical protein
LIQRNAFLFGLLLPALAVAHANAECTNLSGDKVAMGFLECKQHSYVYAGKIAPAARDFLLGSWATNCSRQDSRLVISWSADGAMKTSLQRYDDKTHNYANIDSAEDADIIEAKIIGSMLYTSATSLTHGDMLYNSFASQMIGPNKRRFVEHQMVVFAGPSASRTASGSLPEIRVSIRDGKDLNGDALRDAPILERCSAAPPPK